MLDAASVETDLAQATVARHAWQPIEADLSRWAGQTIRLKLIADVGTNHNSGGDWAGWGDPRLETLGPVLSRQLVAGSEPRGR